MHLSTAHQSLADQIKQLEETREQHAAALAEIDRLLLRISQALRTLHPASPVAQAAKGVNWEALQARVAAPAAEQGRRKYHKMELTGDQSVVAFVKEQGTATTAEINAHWRAEGRGGVANNAIVRLLKRGELVRETSGANRGGRYRYQDEIGRHNLADAPHVVHGEVISTSSPGGSTSPSGSYAADAQLA